jgi:hypothetical protein
MPNPQFTSDRFDRALEEMNKAARNYVGFKGDRSRALKRYIVSLNRLTDLILGDLSEKFFKQQPSRRTSEAVPGARREARSARPKHRDVEVPLRLPR